MNYSLIHKPRNISDNFKFKRALNKGGGGVIEQFVISG